MARLTAPTYKAVMLNWNFQSTNPCKQKYPSYQCCRRTQCISPRLVATRPGRAGLAAPFCWRTIIAPTTVRLRRRLSVSSVSSTPASAPPGHRHRKQNLGKIRKKKQLVFALLMGRLPPTSRVAASSKRKCLGVILLCCWRICQVCLKQETFWRSNAENIQSVAFSGCKYVRAYNLRLTR